MTTKSSSQNKKHGPKDVDAYLASQPEAFRRSLQTLREAIQVVVPEAEEAFVYGVPGFKLDGKPLVGIPVDRER